MKKKINEGSGGEVCVRASSIPLRAITEDFAWEVYNIVREWKAGKYGSRPLQEVLDERL